MINHGPAFKTSLRLEGRQSEDAVCDGLIRSPQL